MSAIEIASFREKLTLACTGAWNFFSHDGRSLLEVLSRSRLLGTIAAVAGSSVTRPTIALAQAPVAVKVGSGNVEANAQVFYAIERGFFEKNGIDAKLTILRSGGVTMEAIVAGQLETGVGNTVSLGSAILRKIPFEVIASGAVWDSTSPTGAIVVAVNSSIKSLADLAGKTLGVTSLRSVDQVAFESYLEQNGVPLSSVKYVELVPSAMAETVAAGRVDAGIINDPELATALAAGRVRKLANAYDGIAKLFLITAWFALHGWVDKNKETAKRFSDAIVAAGIWAEQNRDQAMVTLAKYTKFTETHSAVRYGHRLDPAQLQPVWTAAYKYKIYAAPLNAVDHCWSGS
jgi:NitT/TauT family transport system substrate-binding protein